MGEEGNNLLMSNAVCEYCGSKYGMDIEDILAQYKEKLEEMNSKFLLMIHRIIYIPPSILIFNLTP